MKVFLDDERTAPDGWVQVRWPDEAIELLKSGDVDELSLDHDLGDDDRGTGYTVLLWLEEQVLVHGMQPPKKIVVHSANTSARQKMEAAIKVISEHELPHSPVGIFYDSEFTSLDENWRELISIGLVAENSDDALYIELADGWAKSSCSDFSRDVVLPLLGRHQPEVLSRAAAAARIEEWLRARRPDPEASLLFLSDSDIDWALLLALFEPGWARAQNAVWRHVGQELHGINMNPEYEAALEAYFQKRAQRLLKRGGERHHALVDARALKAAFQHVGGVVSPLAR